MSRFSLLAAPRATATGLSRALFVAVVAAALVQFCPNGMAAQGGLKFSHDRGFYDQPFALAVTTKSADAKIYYTLDGEVPDSKHGTLYSGPIQIKTTTVVRAAAFVDSQPAGPSLTSTFLFLDDVIHQTGAGFPSHWGTNAGQAVVADYEMDREITESARYRDEMLPAMRALPSISLVVRPSDLFDPVTGIYSNPRENGTEWERAASLEFIDPSGKSGFQINCGARIQGGWNRRPEESPKHSFRIVFRKKYGSGRLRYPLFGAEGTGEFDEFILRSGCNNTWLHWNGIERRRGDFIRDQWMRETYAEMGHASARGRFVHLYLNGLYWGLYNPAERPSAPFVVAHFGGRPENYDVRNADKVLEGDDKAWVHLMATANAGLSSPAGLLAMNQQVDLPAFIDFLILNLYGANADWDRSSNWYAARRRDPPGPFYFFVWDGERTLEGIGDNTLKFDDDQSPTRLFQKLLENPTFCRKFAERARLHLTGDGCLTPTRAAIRFRRWSTQLDTAILGESARWGDYRRDVHRYKTGPYELYTRDDHWRPEIKRILEEYFPARTDSFIQQLRKAGLYSGEEKTNR